jgi:hypothetical protein
MTPGSTFVSALAFACLLVCLVAMAVFSTSAPRRSRCLHHHKPGAWARRAATEEKRRSTPTAMLALARSRVGCEPNKDFSIDFRDRCGPRRAISGGNNEGLQCSSLKNTSRLMLKYGLATLATNVCNQGHSEDICSLPVLPPVTQTRPRLAGIHRLSSMRALTKRAAASSQGCPGAPAADAVARHIASAPRHFDVVIAAGRCASLFAQLAEEYIDDLELARAFRDRSGQKAFPSRGWCPCGG